MQPSEGSKTGSVYRDGELVADMAIPRRKRVVGPVSPRAAAAILNKPTREVWADIQSGHLQAVFLPNGMTHVHIEVE